MVLEILGGELAPQSVLIVDRSDDNREVLRTVLQRCGVAIYEASNDHRGLDLVKSVRPDVVVMDSDTVDPSNHQVCDDFNEQLPGAAALVLLGVVEQTETTLRSDETIPKPYQYGPLVRKIEELLRAAKEAE